MDAWGEKIVETDDPRWILAEREIIRRNDAADAAAIVLIEVRATTLAGTLALLRYAVEAENRDIGAWPDGLVDDEECGHSWRHFLLRNLMESLPTLAA